MMWGYRLCIIKIAAKRKRVCVTSFQHVYAAHSFNVDVDARRSSCYYYSNDYIVIMCCEPSAIHLLSNDRSAVHIAITHIPSFVVFIFASVLRS